MTQNGNSTLQVYQNLQMKFCLRRMVQNLALAYFSGVTTSGNNRLLGSDHRVRDSGGNLLRIKNRLISGITKYTYRY